MKRGFTLVEMLVVIGILAVLMGVAVAGFSKMTKTADRAKAQELVSEVVTALTAMFQEEGVWPARLRENKGNGRLDERKAYVLVAKKRYMSLTADKGKTQLSGLDKFGIVTPWAAAAIKRAGNAASASTKVSGSSTVSEHVLYYAVDLDGDGITQIMNEDGSSISVRATACVWCCGKDGTVGTVNQVGRGKGGIFSYSANQIINQ